MCACVYAYVCTVHVCVHVCMSMCRLCVHVCEFMCVCVCVQEDIIKIWSKVILIRSLSDSFGITIV